MFNKDNFDEIAKQAKAKLKQQQEQEETVDLYADLREEPRLTSVESDELYGKIDALKHQQEAELDIVAAEVAKRLENKPTQAYYDEMEQLALDPLDAPIFENGPTRSQVDLWKKEWDGHNVFALNILDEFFVARTINRFEYKQLVALDSVNALQREEVICNTCVLYPVKYDFKAMAISKGGIPSTLSQIIMEASGFTKDYQIQIL